MADTMRPDDKSRTWASLAHLGGFGFVLFGLGHIILPLLVLLFKGDDSPFIKDQARESLNFQISISLYWLISGALIWLGIGFVFLVILAVLDVIFIIVAALRAHEGERYRYPMTLRFV